MKRYIYTMPDKLKIIVLGNNRHDAYEALLQTCTANKWPQSMIIKNKIKVMK